MLGQVKSVRVVGQPADLNWSLSLNTNCVGKYSYKNPAKTSFQNGLTAEDGCVDMTNNLGSLDWSGVPDENDIYVPQSYRIMYSSESSNYFAYQVYANLLGFERSNQQQEPPTGYIRLLTSPSHDDLSSENGGVVPTFISPKHSLANRYGPFNKADAIHRYMQSPQRPSEEVMVVIDPDNWLTASVAPIASLVRPGQGIGAPAFFVGQPQVETLWRDCICHLDNRAGVCKGLNPIAQLELKRLFNGAENAEVIETRSLLDGRACDVDPDHVAVPYFVHNSDMQKIAPLWKLIIAELLHVQPQTGKVLNRLQLNWCAEMYGYIFAAAALKIKHTITRGLQIRDVDKKISWEEWQRDPVLMIHMGRAWLPKEYASPWAHTEGANLRPPGKEQVWCKCNATAGDVVPWPLPPKSAGSVDFVSNITLTYIHDAYAKFGKPPKNKYRMGGYRNPYRGRPANPQIG